MSCMWSHRSMPSMEAMRDEMQCYHETHQVCLWHVCQQQASIFPVGLILCRIQ